MWQKWAFIGYGETADGLFFSSVRPKMQSDISSDVCRSVKFPHQFKPVCCETFAVFCEATTFKAIIIKKTQPSST